MNTPESETLAPASEPVPAKPVALGKWLVAVVVLAVAGFLIGYFPRRMHRIATEKETAELLVTPVQTTQPTPGKGSAALVLPAEVQPYQEASIYARVDGYVKHWYQDIGAQVHEGDLLAEIDTPELNQQLRESKAQLAQSEAAESLARVTADRWAELLKTSSVSEQENAEKQADLTLKSATVEAARANVQRLEELTSFNRVLAPFTGTVTERKVDVGDLVNSGKELFHMADSTRLRIFVRVPQSAAPNVVTNLEARISLPESPALQRTARIVRTAGAIDTTSRTLLVELEEDNSKGDILPGSYAQVTFSDVKMDPAITIPANTLLFRSEGTQVALAGSDGKVQLRTLVLGRDFGRTVEVLGGLSNTDQIILNPTDAMDNGTPIKVVENPAEKKP